MGTVIDRDGMSIYRFSSLNVILLSALLLYCLECYAVPPDPRVYGVSMVEGQYLTYQSIPEMIESPASRPAGAALGDKEIVVILIEFQNVSHDSESDSTYFRNLLFSESNPYSMYSYYHEVSYGQTSLSGTITGWYCSDQDMEYYGADGAKRDMLNGPVYELAREAIISADDAGFDFSQYDKDHDGYVDHIIIVHAGPAQETGGRSYGPDAIWSHHWSIWPPEQVDGVYAGYYSMVSEFSPLGTIAHEFGHDLGVPDLYDTDGSSEGIGAWGIMAAGAWLKGGEVPAHFCAWSKAFLGWIQPREIVMTESGLALDCVEQGNLDTIVKIPLSSDEYFLLENRYKTGFDQHLPGSGLLIWHIDDSVGIIAYNDVNVDETHKRVDLEEADGRDDLDKRMNFGDYKDPYYLDNAPGFMPSTYPSSNMHSGDKSGVSVVNISDAGSTMTLDILFSANSPPVADAGGPYLGAVNENLALIGQGSFDPDGDPLEYRWDFDASDGIQVDSTEENPVCEYNNVGTYIVTLIVNDGRADSEPSVTIADIKIAQEMAIDLLPGWNLISLYLQPLDTDCGSVLSSLEGKYDSIWTYDAAIGIWKGQVFNDLPTLNDLDRIESGAGYWIMMNQPGTLTIQGVQPGTAIPLKADWNLVGYNSQTPTLVESLLYSDESKCNSVLTYDPIERKWFCYDSNVPDFLNNLRYLEPGKGYWIEAKEDHIWDMGSN
jgi:M6 family metalloprotease-like protein